MKLPVKSNTGDFENIGDDISRNRNMMQRAFSSEGNGWNFLTREKYELLQILLV